MKKLVLLFSLALFCASALSAQLMLRGGLNYSNIAIDSNTDNVVFDSKPGYHLGLNANIPLGAFWSLRPAALYHLKGAEVMDGGTIENTNLKYVEVPINLAMNLGPLVIEGGPYFGYLLNTSNGLFNEDSFNKSDWGANFGAVIKLDKLGIGANYSNSLSNISSGNRLGEATKLTNGNLAIFITYKL